MATSGEDVLISMVTAECTAPTVIFGFDLLCNFAGMVDLEFDTDGSATWECPSCHHLHENHISEFDQ